MAINSVRLNVGSLFVSAHIYIFKIKFDTI